MHLAPYCKESHLKAAEQRESLRGFGHDTVAFGFLSVEGLASHNHRLLVAGEMAMAADASSDDDMQVGTLSYNQERKQRCWPFDSKLFFVSCGVLTASF